MLHFVTIYILHCKILGMPETLETFVGRLLTYKHHCDFLRLTLTFVMEASEHVGLQNARNNNIVDNEYVYTKYTK